MHLSSARVCLVWFLTVLAPACGVDSPLISPDAEDPDASADIREDGFLVSQAFPLEPSKTAVPGVGGLHAPRIGSPPCTVTTDRHGITCITKRWSPVANPRAADSLFRR